LVRRGLADSRERAQALIAAGRVLVAGAAITKPARLVAADEAVVVAGPPPPFVGRGGEKLAAALDHFAIDVTGRPALDAGASTGGFTDCLLQRGASRVVAVDVGRAQLHDRLRRDHRVDSRERTDIRAVTAEEVGGPFPLVVADLAFISLRRVVPSLLGLAAPGGDLILLVKPQFEAGRAEVSRGRGVIRDPTVWRRALEGVGDALSERGAAIMDVMSSPIRGADGNVEFLIHAVAPTAPGQPARSAAVDLDAVIAGATPPGPG
jgi:23S rRNA (cytidine1920-2'-O)/16S rRNA (cytidine1409-2'-O)-methyltransferase